MTEGFSRPADGTQPVAPGGPTPVTPPPAPVEPRTGADDSKKDAAKREASDVADRAGENAAQVKDTAANTAKETTAEAKDRATETVTEAKNRAMDLFDQSREELSGQAGQQQQKLAGGLRSFSGELSSLADGEKQEGMANDLARQASSYLDQAGQWLESREPGDLLDEVSTYARRHPGMFMAIAAGAGLLAGRVARGLKDSQQSQQGGGSAPRTATTGSARVPATTAYEPAHGTPAAGTAAPATTPAVPATGTRTATTGYETPGAGTQSGAGEVR